MTRQSTISLVVPLGVGMPTISPAAFAARPPLLPPAMVACQDIPDQVSRRGLGLALPNPVAYAVAYTGHPRDSAAVFSVRKVQSEAETSKAASFKTTAFVHSATPPRLNRTPAESSTSRPGSSVVAA